MQSMHVAYDVYFLCVASCSKVSIAMYKYSVLRICDTVLRTMLMF